MSSINVENFPSDSLVLPLSTAENLQGPYSLTSSSAYNNLTVELRPRTTSSYFQKNTNQAINVNLFANNTVPDSTEFDLYFQSRKNTIIPDNYAFKKVTVVIENKSGFDIDPVPLTGSSSIPLSNPAYSIPEAKVASSLSGAISPVTSVSTIVRNTTQYTYTFNLSNTVFSTTVLQNTLNIRFNVGIDGAYPVTSTSTLFDIISVTGELELLGVIPPPPKLVGVVINNSYYPNDIFRTYRQVYSSDNTIITAIRDALTNFGATPITSDSRFNTDANWLASLIDVTNENGSPRVSITFNNNEKLDELKTNDISLTLYPKGMVMPYQISLIEQKVTVIPRTNRTTTSTITTQLVTTTNESIIPYPLTNDLSVLNLVKRLVETRNESKAYSANNRTYTISYVDTNPQVFRKFVSTDSPSNLFIPGYISKDYILIPSNRVKLDITINNVTTVATQQVGGVTTLSNLIAPII